MKINLNLILMALLTSASLQASQIAQKEADQDRKRATPLEWRMLGDAWNGHLTKETLQKYLEQHVDLNAQDNSGFNALMRASLNGHTTAVQQLIAAGADHTIVSEKNNNKTARDYAKDKDAYDKAVAAGLAERKEYLARQAEAKKIVAEQITHIPGLQDIIMGYAYSSSPLDFTPSQEEEKKSNCPIQ